MYKFLFVFFLVFLGISNLLAKTNSAVFLRINPSAKIVGMGGVGNAVFGDVSNIEINPAGLIWVQEQQLYFAYNKWFQDINMTYAAYALPLGESQDWVIAISGKQLKIDGLTERNEVGIELGSFDAKDSAYTLTLAKRISRSFSFGITGKTITQQIYKESGDTYAGDIGCIFNINRSWNIGASIRNIGNDLKVYKKAFPLPMTYSLGMGFYPENFNIGLDIEKEVNCSPIFRTGIEYFLADNFDIRGGYMFTNDEYANNGLSLGFGFNSNYKIFIDYAFVPFGDLGDTHRISLKYLF